MTTILHPLASSHLGLWSVMVALSMTASQVQPQNRLAAIDSLQPWTGTLVREFQDTSLIAVSPDGSKLCLYFTKHPLMTFTIRGDSRTSEGGSVQGEVLNVVETKAWKPIYTSHHLRSRFVTGSFFSDSEVLYLETVVLSSSSKDTQQFLVNVRTGQSNEHIRHLGPSDGYIGYIALNDQTLLGMQSAPNEADVAALILAELPDFRETARVPYSVPAAVMSKSLYQGAYPVVSADRKTLVHADGHFLVFRRTEDLGVVWTRSIEPELFGIRRLSITPGGDRVAAAVLDFQVQDRQPRHYIGVYDGHDGATLARLSLDGTEGLAISPDGKLVALGSKISGPRNIDLAVGIYEVASGRKVATVLHDSVAPGRYQRLVANFDVIQFTPDGRYLVTSGNNHVKIWELGGCCERAQPKPGNPERK